jgi:hypothetical protein
MFIIIIYRSHFGSRLSIFLLFSWKMSFDMVDVKNDRSNAIIELARRYSGITVAISELETYNVDTSNVFTVDHMSLDDLKSYSDVQSVADNKLDNSIKILDDDNQGEYNVRHYRSKIKEMEQISAHYQNFSLQMTAENERNVAIISKQDKEIKSLKEQLHDVKAISAACDVSEDMTEFKEKYAALKRESRQLKEEVERLRTSLEDQDQIMATIANKLEDKGITLNDLLGPPEPPTLPENDPLKIITNLANKTTSFSTPSNTMSSAAKNSIMHMMLLAIDEPDVGVKELILSNHVHVVFKRAPEMYEISQYSDVYNRLMTTYSDIPRIEARENNVSAQLKTYYDFIAAHQEIIDMLGKQPRRDKKILIDLLPDEIAIHVKKQIVV